MYVTPMEVLKAENNLSYDLSLCAFCVLPPNCLFIGIYSLLLLTTIESASVIKLLARQGFECVSES
jgi:hypothetical protein